MTESQTSPALGRAEVSVLPDQEAASWRPVRLGPLSLFSPFLPLYFSSFLYSSAHFSFPVVISFPLIFLCSLFPFFPSFSHFLFFPIFNYNFLNIFIFSFFPYFKNYFLFLIFSLKFLVSIFS